MLTCSYVLVLKAPQLMELVIIPHILSWAEHEILVILIKNIERRKETPL